MSAAIETLDVADWNPTPAAERTTAFIAAVENGKVLFCPQLRFALSAAEERFLDPSVVGDQAKSLAFDPGSGALKHARSNHDELATMMRRYADTARGLICALLPRYRAALQTGRTSFRPLDIKGRATSVTKDDTLLHVDAFPTSPVGDRRILRVFSNVNTNGKSRYWRLGEPFAEVAGRFYPKLRKPIPGSAWLMKTAGLTRGYRTAYDHAMLAIHDEMKRATHYQESVPQSEFHFPPGSTWIVFTDMVSHAALSGQHLFEQTFYLPVSAMADSAKAPLRILETLARQALVPSAQHTG
jgi:hypothetical protein